MAVPAQIRNDHATGRRRDPRPPPASDTVTESPLEVLLNEALRSTDATTSAPGLVRELADDRLVEGPWPQHPPEPNDWLTDNNSRCIAEDARALFITIGMDLDHDRFTAALQRNGRDFIKSVGREYVSVNPFPDAATDNMANAACRSGRKMLGYRAPREVLSRQPET